MIEIAFIVLLVIIVAGFRAVAGSRVAAWITLGAALVWPFVNRPMEGPVLLTIGQGHGVTMSDLLALAVVQLSVLVLTGRLRRSVRGSNAGGDAL